MDILSALGVDATLGIQFIIFLVTYIFLVNVVFKPYHRAYEERVKRTHGNAEVAERILAETKELEVEFEQKARLLNYETKGIFDSERSEAMKEYDRTVSQARERAKSTMEKNRASIVRELARAREFMRSGTPDISRGVVDKLIGLEVEK